MYPNILLSVFIALTAFTIIGGMLNNPRLVKAAGVLIVAVVATALILWLRMGLCPVPNWLTKTVVRLVHAGQRLGYR
jgi:predicted tellurium resistance membrane protein TerC